jgi:CheY-like chemotaxis protein
MASDPSPSPWTRLRSNSSPTLRSCVGHRVPIIAMTVLSTLVDRERCLAAGMDDYLSEPIRRGELEGILGRFLPSDAANAQAPARTGIAAPEFRSEPSRARTLVLLGR